MQLRKGTMGESYQNNPEFDVCGILWGKPTCLVFTPWLLLWVRNAAASFQYSIVVTRLPSLYALVSCKHCTALLIRGTGGTCELRRTHQVAYCRAQKRNDPNVERRSRLYSPSTPREGKTVVLLTLIGSCLTSSSRAPCAPTASMYRILCLTWYPVSPSAAARHPSYTAGTANHTSRSNVSPQPDRSPRSAALQYRTGGSRRASASPTHR